MQDVLGVAQAARMVLKENDPPIAPKRPRARLATLDELRLTLLASYLAPVPTDKTLRAWFTQAGIPRIKSNPTAKHGGGTVWWHVSAVEKLLRQKAGLIGYGDVEGSR